MSGLATIASVVSIAGGLTSIGTSIAGAVSGGDKGGNTATTNLDAVTKESEATLRKRRMASVAANNEEAKTSTMTQSADTTSKTLLGL